MRKNQLPNWEFAYDRSIASKGVSVDLSVTSVEDFAIAGRVLTPYHKESYVDYTNIIGFIYEIEFSNGKKYIGKKNLYRVSNVPKTKKELSQMVDKRGSKKKTIVKESDWKNYIGTHKDKQIHRDVKTGVLKVLSRKVLQVASTKIQLTYIEAQFLFENKVLESSKFINDNILGKFFGKNLGCAAKEE